MNNDKLVVIFMGSSSDYPRTEDLRETLDEFSIPYEVRALSAHKLTQNVLDAVDEYENMPEKKVYIAIAGRSNALGPVVAGNTSSPVINCPVITSYTEDLFSSLRMPSATPCSTILEPRNAALHAVKIFSMEDENLKTKFLEWKEELFNSLVEEDLQYLKKQDPSG